jgi:hypothetical protein
MSQAITHSGAVDGGARNLLCVEGFMLMSCAMGLYFRVGGDWKQFALLFLAPDLSFAGYLGGPRVGAAAYNAMHSTVAPLVLGAVGVLLTSHLVLTIALIWMAHIGFDRTLGYGLKHSKGFGFTHLGRIGRPVKES